MTTHEPIFCPHGKVTSWRGTSTTGEMLPEIEHCEQCNPGATALLKQQIDKARTPDFMARLKASIAKHKHILDRLAGPTS